VKITGVRPISGLILGAVLLSAIIFAPLTGYPAAQNPAGPEGEDAGSGGRHFSAEMNCGAVFVTEKRFGRGFRYGGGVLLNTGRRSGVEILFDTFAVRMSEGAAGLEAGKMEMRSLLFNGHLFFPNRSRVLPYAIAGVGFCFLDFRPDAPLPAGEKDFVDRFALQLGGGLDFRISSRVAVSGKIRYNMVKTWGEELPRQDPIRETDLYGLNLSLGLKFSF
jgi:opacity protein-like surface antigen